jgi:hypothetical protein
VQLRRKDAVEDAEVHTTDPADTGSLAAGALMGERWREAACCWPLLAVKEWRLSGCDCRCPRRLDDLACRPMRGRMRRPP